MDYQQLKTILPKLPQKWSPNDIQTWLKFIGLQSLVSSFKFHSIDGSCILTLEQNDLKQELQIGSGIVIKKIMTWIRVGLKQYEQFLLKQNAYEESYKNIKNYSEMEIQKYQDNERQGEGYNDKEREIVTIEMKEFHDDESSTFGTLELYLEQITTGEPSQKILIPKEKQGYKIGRNSSNDLVIPEAEVSRNHAEINYSNGNFYLKDLSSTTGTFIKILDPIEIRIGNIIQIGSHLLQVEDLTYQKITLSMISQEGPKLLIEKYWNNKNQIGIGRKSTNDIIIEDDSHMSNNHAILYEKDARFYFKDLGTTNGSWLKLSPEPYLNNIYQIKQETVFKVGPTITYLCKLKYVFPESSIEVDEKLNCAICYVNTRDCVIQPCNHSNTCMKCCKNLKECPICRIKIEQTLKIYHF